MNVLSAIAIGTLLGLAVPTHALDYGNAQSIRTELIVESDSQVSVKLKSDHVLISIKEDTVDECKMPYFVDYSNYFEYYEECNDL